MSGVAGVKLEHDYLVDLEDAAVIRRDVKGKLHVTTPAHHAVAWGTLSGLFWGVLIGLLLLFPITTLVGVAGGLIGAAVGEAKNLDIKDDFKQRVQDVVQPGTSRSWSSSARPPRTRSRKRCGPTAGRCCGPRSPAIRSSSS